MTDGVKTAPVTIAQEWMRKGNDENLQYENAQNRRARAQSTFSWTAIIKHIASSPILLFVFFLLLPSVFASGHVRGDSNPCGEPQESKEQIQRCKGVGIGKFSGSRPHRDGTQVDQGGNREPTLRLQGE